MKNSKMYLSLAIVFGIAVSMPIHAQQKDAVGPKGAAMKKEVVGPKGAAMGKEGDDKGGKDKVGGKRSGMVGKTTQASRSSGAMGAPNQMKGAQKMQGAQK